MLCNMIKNEVKVKAGKARVEKLHERNLAKMLEDARKEFPNLSEKATVSLITFAYNNFRENFKFFRKDV